jgi:2-haloacid dehalogenase
MTERHQDSAIPGLMADKPAEPSSDQPRSTGQRRPPQLMVFDVNETLSDMSGMAEHFADVGAPPALARTWFASLLRDGFALTVGGANPEFADLAATSLAAMLTAEHVADVDSSVDRVMRAFTSLPVHPDVVDGIRDLAALGIRLVTLSNGSTTVAEGLFERSGITGHFERLLSVHDAPAWKPAQAAYQYALNVCDADGDDTVLVAVHPWDIHGARQAGLRTAYINRGGATYPTYFDRADVEVTSLVELAAHFDDANR